MQNQRDFISALKWPALAAALVACALAFLSAQESRNSAATSGSEPVAIARVDMREAMRILHDEHGRILDQVDRQQAEIEQKAAEDAHAFDQARLAAEQARLAAAEEAARKLAEQRAAETKRIADASPPKTVPRPKPEPAASGAPLDIVPVAGGESGPLVAEPLGPIEAAVAKASAFTGEIKDKAVATVTDIKDWFAAAGDKLLGRDKAPSSMPASRFMPASW